MPFDDRSHLDQLTNLQRLVTAMVRRRLLDMDRSSTPAIARLQRLEQAAWNLGADRQTLQVITSGRRLLGDKVDLTPLPRHRKPVRDGFAELMPLLR